MFSQIRARGQWRESSQFGRRLFASAVRVGELPSCVHEPMLMLESKEFGDQMGRSLLKSVTSVHGSNALHVIDSAPAELRNIPGIGPVGLSLPPSLPPSPIVWPISLHSPFSA
jgi:hypothetical protein